MSTTEPDSPRVRQLEHRIEELEAHARRAVVQGPRFLFEFAVEDEAVVIGDKLNDVNSALEIGCNAVLVDRQNFYDPNRHGCGFTVISNLKKLPTLLSMGTLNPD